MSFLVLPQHEQFYPEGLSYYALENLGWIKLAPKSKNFPAPTAIFKDFQGLELFISNFKDFPFKVRANPVRGFRRTAYKRSGLYPGGLITAIEKAL